MMRSLWTAATGMAAQALNVDVIANNLANVNTTGFKRGRANFEDLMYQQISSPGSQNSAGNQVPNGIQVGLGVRTAGIDRVQAEGNFQQTGNPLDLAIEGRGFIQVLLPSGELAYTRGGSLSINSLGQIVTQDGYPMIPTLTIPQNAMSVTITPDGSISAVQPGNISTILGQLQLADFANPAGLTGIGQNMLQQSVGSGPPIIGAPGVNGLGTVAQGTLETSNVSAVEEMVNLIAAQRAYEMNSKAIQAADEMLQAANNIRR
ncbi:MAG: flagellar basal-body rod protein FlgG [Zetaproteobacteria bacterium]|nr:MAG: flagellar basal-body rod protein FlgG [Zetaproteobacteria bacterium]